MNPTPAASVVIERVDNGYVVCIQPSFNLVALPMGLQTNRFVFTKLSDALKFASERLEAK